MKGIILAGGSGTRLSPMTKTISKQLLPVYDKPMVYYPLALLMGIGIREILIISTPRDIPMIETLLGDGSQLGISISYKVQPSPDGIAQAFILGEKFINGEPSCLVLGDNIFYGQELMSKLEKATKLKKGGLVMAYHVKDPERYGVTGLYFYDEKVVEIAKKLKPSARGELEITDVNREYLQRGELQVEMMGRGVAWLDTGTPEALLQAAQFIQVVEERQGLKIACIEEIAYHRGFINGAQLEKLAESYGKHTYGQYLQLVLKEAARA